MEGKKRRRSEAGRFEVARAASVAQPRMIPVRWLNTVIGIFLLPVAGVLTQTFFGQFTEATLTHGFWRTEEFWFFSLGALLWLIMFFGLPKPVLIYVFGHELTHAVWAWAMGGRVSDFSVRRDGGHIVTDKHNVLIALAPYFYPIYSLLVLLAYAVLGFFTDPLPWHRWFFGLLGATWSFHITFTLWMIPKGQTDLKYHGTFFSLVVIYLMNLLLLAVMLIIAAPEVTLRSFGGAFVRHAAEFAAWVAQHLQHARF